MIICNLFILIRFFVSSYVAGARVAQWVR